MRRYDEGYVALKKVVDSQIGAPIMVHAAHRNPTVPEAYTTPMAIHDTLIHEIDVFRWLLDDDYVSARVTFPRSCARTHAKLRDPQIVTLTTAKGVVITTEILKPRIPAACRFAIAAIAVSYEPGPRTASLTSGVAPSNEICTST